MKDETMVLFERLIVERLDEERKKMGISEEALGKKAYADKKREWGASTLACWGLCCIV